MSNANDETTSNADSENLTEVRLTGRVKWFNNRAGFGFVTVLDGEKKNEDVFVHHSGIVVESEQYKYLVQGEYVSFVLRTSDNQDHPYQAGDVKGVYSGWLMCETRNANRSSRDGEEENDGEGGQVRGRPRVRRTPGREGGNGNRRVRPRGGGPREGDGEEWVLTRRSRPQRRTPRENQD